MTHAVANLAMIPQKSGRIVNVIANIVRGFPGMVHTGAARAGVDVRWFSRGGVRCRIFSFSFCFGLVLLSSLTYLTTTPVGTELNQNARGRVGSLWYADTGFAFVFSFLLLLLLCLFVDDDSLLLCNRY